MRTLLYKMTHIGDPDPATGLWGETDCMGQVRGYQFDAVIGIGGTSAGDGIAGKIVWIGIGPRKNGDPLQPLVKFDHFSFHGNRGPSLQRSAPKLAGHMYDGRVRVLLNFSPEERSEVDLILARSSRNFPRPVPAQVKRRCR
jgi:hypothetical protein